MDKQPSSEEEQFKQSQKLISVMQELEMILCTYNNESNPSLYGGP